MGLDILSGGTSEVVFYTPQSAWEAMQRSAHDAAARGRPWDLTDALRSGYGQAIKDTLPVNTILALSDPDKRTLSNLATTLFGDALNAIKTRRIVNNLGMSLNAYQNGGTLSQILTAKPPPPVAADPARWPSEQPEIWRRGRDVNGLGEGAPVRPAEFGMLPASGRHANMVADKYGININVRPTNLDSLPRLAAGDLPKPMFMKTNTITDLDIALGASPVGKGRVGYFQPQMPDTTGMSADQIAAITKRFNTRMKSFADNAEDMAALTAKGQIEVINGIVYNRATGRAYTGDHDLFSFTRQGYDKSTGTYITREIPESSPLYRQIVRDLQHPPFNAQHGAHLQWQYSPTIVKPDGSVAPDSHFAQNYSTDVRVRTEHTSKPEGGDGKALISFGPDRAPHTGYCHGPKDRFAP
jgi:hypothetical protein